MLKENDFHESKCQPVVNRHESHERSGISGTSWNEDLLDIIERKTFWFCLSRNGTAETVVNPQTRKNQSNVWYSRKRLHVTQKNRDQNPSFGLISCPRELSAAPINTPKMEDLSQEETKWQSNVPMKQRGSWPKVDGNIKETNKAAFFSPSENWCLLASSNLEPEDRELFVVDFRAPMHMINPKDLNSDVFETVTKSCSHTTIVTTNKAVQTHEITSLSWICSWLWKSSRIRQQFYRSESFAMNTDTLTNGSTVKNHISFENGVRIVQHRELCCDRGSWFVIQFFLQLSFFHIAVSCQNVERQERGDLLTNPTKNPKPPKKNEDEKERGDPFWSEIRNGCNTSEKISWMMEFLNAETHTPVLLMGRLWSLRLREVRIWVNAMFTLTSLKTDKLRELPEDQNYKAPV